MKILRGNKCTACVVPIWSSLYNNIITVTIVLCVSILGGSENGQWLVEKEKATAAQADLKMEDTSEDNKGTPLLKTTILHNVNLMCTGPDNMYMYEGEDYSKSSDEDKKNFDQLLAGTDSFKYYIKFFWGGWRGEVEYSCFSGWYRLAEQLKLSESELGERVLRSEHRLPATAGLELAAVATRKRKSLTPEQLEDRRKKVSTRFGAKIKDCMDIGVYQNYDLPITTIAQWSSIVNTAWRSQTEKDQTAGRKGETKAGGKVKKEVSYST